MRLTCAVEVDDGFEDAGVSVEEVLANAAAADVFLGEVAEASVGFGQERRQERLVT